jgi:hypothetical protein
MLLESERLRGRTRRDLIVWVKRAGSIERSTHHFAKQIDASVAYGVHRERATAVRLLAICAPAMAKAVRAALRPVPSLSLPPVPRTSILPASCEASMHTAAHTASRAATMPRQCPPSAHTHASSAAWLPPMAGT